MRTLILAGLGTLIVTAAWAGQVTVTVDDTLIGAELATINARIDQQNAKIAAQPGPPIAPGKPVPLTHITAQQLVQGWVDQRVKSNAMAEQNRAWAQLQRECRTTGSPVACAKIEAATKGVK
jgi:hypothetical protein